MWDWIECNEEAGGRCDRKCLSHRKSFYDADGQESGDLRTVADVAGALPLMFAGSPDITDIGALLDAVDGVVLTGARANVHPTRFGTEANPRHEPYDVSRDDLALALSEACVARGVPLFGICRGLQEMTVAFGGGSLHPEIRDLPGRMKSIGCRGWKTAKSTPTPPSSSPNRHEVTWSRTA